MTLFSTHQDLDASLHAELADILSSREMPLYKMMSYHMGWTDQHGAPDNQRPADRTHGLLCLLTCRAVGDDAEKALPAAAALELANNFCQIHDDVQSGSPQRGQRDTVWWVWGPAQAINTGDGMHAMARLALFRMLQRGVSPEVTFRAIRLLDDACLRLCEGKFMDLEAQERIDISVASYLDMVESKAGALVSCAMQLGALVGSGQEEAIEALGTCGARLGTAMQLRADLREMWSDGVGETPAVPSTELMNKKKILPVVYAIEKAAVRDKRRMGDIYFKRVLEPDDLVRLREIVESLGVREDCDALVARYLAEALEPLGALGLSEEGKRDIEGFVTAAFE